MTKTKQTQPLVSVLIPVYNGVEFIDETIASILASTYPHFEIILVDDGSKDRSRHKCQQYSKQHAHIHFYRFTNNKGLTRSLNFGINKAHGKYIARINQDDLMMPDRLAQQVAFLESHPDHVVVGGQIELFTHDNPHYDHLSFPLTDEQIRSQWLYVSPYSDPTVMYRKDAWQQTEGYSQYFWPADDVHMWYQLGQVGKMANLNQILTRVRWHEKCGSLAHHRRQMIKTWQVHYWAAEMIEQPVIWERAFWIGELLAGLLLPAKVNWWVYRQLRKIQSKWYASKNKLRLSPQLLRYSFPEMSWSWLTSRFPISNRQQSNH